ncbi:MAG: hypothetical protein JRH20_25950 [Deltaproteobacteria bacterium]|nr:hypothetical protein [Deltaproteobacteria bacterium]
MPILGEGAALADAVEPTLGDPSLLMWVGPDEALWNGRSADDVRTQVYQPLRALDPHTPFLLNHAPRASQSAPLSFDLLLPFFSMTQIAAMDIYPVPEGNGHSNLPGHGGLSAVGAYTDIMRDLVVRSLNPQPLMMVLLGAGLGKIPAEDWRILEPWVTTSIDAAALRVGVVCDLDGDGKQEVVVVSGATNHGVIDVYDFQRSAFGERERLALSPIFNVSQLRHLVCADMDGDQKQDLILAIDGGEAQQDIWVMKGSAPLLTQPALAMRYPQNAFTLDALRHMFAGDFDKDGCDDLALSYDYPDGKQSLLVLRPRCQGLSQTTEAETWYETDTVQLDLESWVHAVVGDFTGDGRTDLVFGRSEGTRTQLMLLNSSGNSFNAPQLVYDTSTATLDLSQAKLVASELDGGKHELVVAHGDELKVLESGATNSSFDSRGPWYQGTGLNGGEVLQLGGGDVDGDGLGDVVVFDFDSEGSLRLRLATSTGTKFAARDPQPSELRFMAFDALAHGSAGLVFWGQEFAPPGHVSWSRLEDLVQELKALPLAGNTLTRQKQNALYGWWSEDAPGLLLVALNETRESHTSEQRWVLPTGYDATIVKTWDAARRQFLSIESVTLSAGVVVDNRPMAPYAVRIYSLSR